MRHRILSTKISSSSLAAARQRSRQVGDLFGLDTLQRTRFITAISEITRNTVQYAGTGTLAFLFDTRSALSGNQCVVAEISDRGPGIADLDNVLKGLREAPGTSPSGIAAARRLVDQLHIRTPEEGGTVVTVEMELSRGHRGLSVEEVNERVGELAMRKAQSPLEEVEQQNREMLFTLEELRQKQISLEQADLRKNEFLAMLAHELRNPLATLTLCLELLKRAPFISAEDLVSRREMMTRQTDQLRRLVDDLLDVARVTRGKVKLQRAPSEINGLVRSAMEMVAAAVQERGHSITFQAAGRELWVYGDSARLLQVVGNVIHNATRYTPEHGRIEIAVRNEGANAAIDVIDNGVGIAPEMLPQVFGLFVQAHDKALSSASGGLGVGLTLADRLLQDHGGAISVKSEGMGKGSQFTITLPLMADAAAA
jgi:signal transduction histidine kinase